MGDRIVTFLLFVVGMVWLGITILIFLAPVILILALSYWLVGHA